MIQVAFSSLHKMEHGTNVIHDPSNGFVAPVRNGNKIASLIGKALRIGKLENYHYDIPLGYVVKQYYHHDNKSYVTIVAIGVDIKAEWYDVEYPFCEHCKRYHKKGCAK